MKEKRKIAIIGAGPAGLYTAWRLIESKKVNKEEIVIFDAADQIGGRVCTLPIPNFPFVAELGAMRFIKNRQVLINAIIEELHLGVKEHNVPLFCSYARGKFIVPVVKDGHPIRMKKELVVAGEDQTVFQLTSIEEYFAPTDLILFAIAKALSKITLTDARIDPEVSDNVYVLNTKVSTLKAALNLRDKEESSEYAKRVSSYLSAKFNFQFFTYKEWKIIREAAFYRGGPLHETCLFRILQEELSNEAVILAQESLGYSSIFGLANAAEHIPWFLNEFNNPKYESVIGGMSRLCEELLNRISGGDNLYKLQNVKLNHLLLSLEKEGEERKYSLRFKFNGEEDMHYKFDEVFLSVSKGSLERIHFDYKFNVNSELVKLTGSSNLAGVSQCVSGLPLMKAFLFFERAWFWDNLSPGQKSDILDRNERIQWLNIDGDKLASTKFVTDLPIKQIFFHGLAPGKVWVSSTSKSDELVNAMVMAYGDSKQSELWASLAGGERIQDQGKKNYVITPKFREEYLKNDERAERKFGTTKPLADMLMSNIKIIMNHVIKKDILDEIHPCAVFMQDWSKAPYYGGWHAWKVGYEPWKIRKHIMSPFKSESIFVIGEVFSTDQGWIEGAFRTAERTLRDHFKLPTPKWLTDSKAFKELKETSWESKGNAEATIDNYLEW